MKTLHTQSKYEGHSTGIFEISVFSELHNHSWPIKNSQLIHSEDESNDDDHLPGHQLTLVKSEEQTVISNKMTELAPRDKYGRGNYIL